MKKINQRLKGILKVLLPLYLYKKTAGITYFFNYFFIFMRARKSLAPIFKHNCETNSGTRIKPVFFFGNYRLASFKLGGVYLIEALKQMGINAKPGKYRSSKKIHGSILVTIKKKYIKNLQTLKNNNNKIIIDVRDNYFEDDGIFNPNFFGRDLADHILFPHQALLDKFLSIAKTDSVCTVLHGYADPAISYFFKKKGYREFNQLQSCYFGSDYNLDINRIENSHNGFSLTQIPTSVYSFNQYITRLRNFNMHIDLNPVHEDCLYKPLTKLLIAAECRSNIIIKKTPRILEILPSDYPFLIEGDSLENVLEKANTIYNTPEWNDALSVMDDIRETYSFNNHVKKFTDILKELSHT